MSEPTRPDMKSGATTTDGITRLGLLKGSLAAAGGGGLAALLTACGGSEKAKAGGTPARGGDGTYYIVSAVGPNTTSFMAVNRNGAMQAGKDLGVKVVFSYPQPPDESKQISLLKAAIAANPAGVAIDLFSPAASSPLIESMQAKGIPVVLWNLQAHDDATDVEKSLAYVGQDEFQSGRTLATQLTGSLKPGSTVLFVHAFRGFPSTARGGGAYDVLKAAGFKVAPPLFCDLDIAKGQGLVDAYVSRHGDVDAFIANDDVAAQAVARYLIAAGKKDAGVPFASFDLTAPTAPHVESGLLTFVLSQQPFAQGYQAILNLYLAHAYEQNPVNVNTGTLIVDRKNVKKLKQLVKEGRGG